MAFPTGPPRRKRRNYFRIRDRVTQVIFDAGHSDIENNFFLLRLMRNMKLDTQLSTPGHVLLDFDYPQIHSRFQ